MYFCCSVGKYLLGDLSFMIFPHFLVFSDEIITLWIFAKWLHQGIFFQLNRYFFTFNFLVSLMLILKGQVELQVMTNCFLDLHKTFIIVEGRGSLMFFNYKKKFINTCVFYWKRYWYPCWLVQFWLPWARTPN